MNNLSELLKLRDEYREYAWECRHIENEKPMSFRDWLDVVYHYEIEDNK